MVREYRAIAGIVDTTYKPKSSEVVATYYVEPSRVSFKKIGEYIAGESSIGTWTDVKTLSPAIVRNLKPHVFSVTKKGAGGVLKIAYSAYLFEPGNMAQIFSSLAGNIFGMKAVKNLRLRDIEFPKTMTMGFKGPQFGIKGIRKLTKVRKRPLIGTIVKPKLGLTAREHARVAYEAWVGGLDLVKDDENLTSMSFNRFGERARLTLKARDMAEKETGEKKLYACNCTAEAMEMLRRAEVVKQYGGEVVMVDFLTAGFSGYQTLRRNNRNQMLYDHRAMHAALTKNPYHGISMYVLAKVARLIGSDFLHTGTAEVGKMTGGAKEVNEINDMLRSKVGKWNGIEQTLPMASGGLHPGKLDKLVKLLGKDIGANAGGGVHGHPRGTLAGARAMRQAADAVSSGVTLKSAARKAKELREALDFWGI